MRATRSVTPSVPGSKNSADPGKMQGMRKAIPIAIGVAAVLFVAASFLGGIWWGFDLLANFRVQMAAGTLALILILGLAGSLPGAGLAAVAFLINAAVIAPLFLPASEASRSELTVLSFNLLSSNDNYEEVLEYVLESEADVVFLHEGTAEWEAAIAEARLPYEMVSTRAPEFAFGTIALVPDGAETVDYGFARTDPRAIEVRWEGFALLGIHPLAPVSERSAELRDEQLAFAADWARRVRGPAIVAGDFNSTPWTHAFRTLFGDEDFTNTQRGHGFDATWRAGTIWQVPIDHIVVTSDLTVIERELGPALGSDHLPVFAEIGPKRLGP